jgi:hypothetical protein
MGARVAGGKARPDLEYAHYCALASAPRPNQSGAECDDVAGSQAHPDHGRGLHRAHGVRIEVQGLRLRVGHRRGQVRSSLGWRANHTRTSASIPRG